MILVGHTHLTAKCNVMTVSVITSDAPDIVLVLCRFALDRSRLPLHGGRLPLKCEVVFGYSLRSRFPLHLLLFKVVDVEDVEV